MNDDETPLTRMVDGRHSTAGDPASTTVDQTSTRNDDACDLLYAAVNHTLDQIQVNPDVRYYCGWGTQIFYLLIRAEAAYLGKPLEEVEVERRKDRQPSYRRREPEVLRLREQRDELRTQLDGGR